MSVVAFPPLFDHHFGLGQARKDLGIQALFPERAVEAFVAAVLPWAARIDGAQCDATFVHFGFQHARDKFRAVIASDRSGATV